MGQAAHQVAREFVLELLPALCLIFLDQGLQEGLVYAFLVAQRAVDCNQVRGCELVKLGMGHRVVLEADGSHHHSILLILGQWVLDLGYEHADLSQPVKSAGSYFLGHRY